MNINKSAQANVGGSYSLRVSSNDNSVIIQGQGPDGYVNQSILFDDPDFDTKIANMIDAMESFQREKIQLDANKALANYDESVKDLKSAVNKMITENQ